MDFLNSDLRVLNFTHNDLDGAVSAIVLNNVYSKVKNISIGKSQLNTVVETIQTLKDDYDVAIFTDIAPSDILGELRNTGFPFVVIDHHATELEHHDPANNIFIQTDRCGAKCAYDMYSGKFNLTRLGMLVDLADDFDMWRLKLPGSCNLNTIFRHYKFNKFVETFKRGFFGFTNKELAYIDKYNAEAAEYVKQLRVFDLPNNGAWTESTKYYTEIMRDFEEVRKIKWYAIGNRCADGTHKVSLRCRIDGVNIGDIAKKLGYGGGHPTAAGMIIPKGVEVTPVLARISDMIGGAE